MNKFALQRLVDISIALKPIKQTGLFFHTSFAIKKGKVQCIGWNQYDKTHPEKRFGKYISEKFPNGDYRPCLHSEIHMIIRLGVEDLSDYEVVNIRIGNNGDSLESKPCVNCSRVLKALSVKRIYHTNKNGEFENFKF